MTQYHYELPPTTAVEPAMSAAVRDSNELENRVRNLADRVEQQAAALREIERSLRRLQNEIRVAVNAFNFSRHG